MKAYIAVAVAAVVGTLLLVGGTAGVVLYVTKDDTATPTATGSSAPVQSEAVSILNEVWYETPANERDAICTGYFIDSNEIVTTLVDGNATGLTYEEADMFLLENC